jgi:3-dehydroquinate dehydratase/shikimate dehydrogenase
MLFWHPEEALAKICICLTARTLELDLRTLEKYRRQADIAELRVDCLDPDERLHIRRFPGLAGMPIILTVRRKADGGRFSGGEGARLNTMARGLVHADMDRRKNFAYIDLEEDTRIPSLEEAARTYGTRIIRSYHNIKGETEGLYAKIRSISRVQDEIIKVALAAKSTWDVLALLKMGREIKNREKIIIAMGHYGVYSRILAERFGSVLSYASPEGEEDDETVLAAPGQLGVETLNRVYRFREISPATKVYGLASFDPEPEDQHRFLNRTFAMEGIDAVSVPFPADSIQACMEMAKELGMEGFSVASPYKESVLPFLDSVGPEVLETGACNTVLLEDGKWTGANTEAKAFAASLAAFLGGQSLRRKKVTVIGAGCTAKSAALELRRLGAKALILNRNVRKARAIAAPCKFTWATLDERGLETMEKFRDLIIQATPAGTGSFGLRDPAKQYSFCGREKVMDLVYRPEQTPFLKRAAEAGCSTQNGSDLFLRLAKSRFSLFTGNDFPDHMLPKILKSGG